MDLLNTTYHLYLAINTFYSSDFLLVSDFLSLSTSVIRSNSFLKQSEILSKHGLHVL